MVLGVAGQWIVARASSAELDATVRDQCSHNALRSIPRDHSAHIGDVVYVESQCCRDSSMRLGDLSWRSAPRLSLHRDDSPDHRRLTAEPPILSMPEPVLRLA